MLTRDGPDRTADLPPRPQGMFCFVCHPQHPMFPRGLGRKSRQEHQPERFFYPDLSRKEYSSIFDELNTDALPLTSMIFPERKSVLDIQLRTKQGVRSVLGVLKKQGFRAKHVQTYLSLCRMNPLQILAVSGKTHHPIDLDSWKAKARARPVGQMALVSSSLMMPSADASGGGYI